MDGNGEKITPNGSVKFMFRADDYFDRSKVKVYYMDEDGGITKLSAKGLYSFFACIIIANNTNAFFV